MIVDRLDPIEIKFPLYSLHCKFCNKNMGYSEKEHHPQELICHGCFEKHGKQNTADRNCSS